MKLFGLAAAWLALAFDAGAVTPQHVVLDTYSDFASGRNVSTSLNERGILSPAPQVDKVGDVDAGQIWSVLPERDGKFLIGTSPDGKLFRMDDSGKSVLVTKFSESHIYATARNPAGDVFVATSPQGKIFKIVPNGKPVVYFEPNEEYIWALLFDKNGVLYAATGTKGRIYRITGEGKGEIYYSSDETHIRSLAFDKEGRLLAGSADSGYLYRITRQGEGVVLNNSGRQEVNQIVVAPDGTIFFSAVGTAKSSGTSGMTKTSATSALAGLRALLAVAGESDGSGSGKSGGSSNTPGNGSKGKNVPVVSQLFRLDASLFAAEIWHSSETILTLAYRGGNVYAGTGGDGYLYSITPRGEVTRLLKVEGETVSAMALLGEERFVLATSNPSKLFLAGGSRHGMVGVYESDVIDSGSFARWGSVNLKSQGRVEILSRSGNTPKPDKSWYEWTLLKDDHVQSVPARYLQVQLRLQDASVDRVDAVYLPVNSPPHISRVEVLEPGVGYLAIVPAPPQPQAKTAEQLLANVGKPDSETGMASLPVRFQPNLQRGLRTVVWKATDPDGDALTYTIYQSRDLKGPWRLLAKDYKDSVLSWDSSGWADGNYYIKIVASDAGDNAPKDALTDEMVSRMITVDNSPPEIVRLASLDGKVRFRVTDAASLLVSVEVSTNGKDFHSVVPVDGIIDSRSEEFEVPLNGSEVLFIRAEDEFGNVKGETIERPGAAPLNK